MDTGNEEDAAEGRTARARRLRRDSTDVERKLWRLLRARTIGVKFRRQHPIGPYFADFACVERKLVIELDGSQHDAERDKDTRRTADLEKLGWRIIRFWNEEVLTNINGVWGQIVTALKTAQGR